MTSIFRQHPEDARFNAVSALAGQLSGMTPAERAAYDAERDEAARQVARDMIRDDISRARQRAVELRVMSSASPADKRLGRHLEVELERVSLIDTIKEMRAAMLCPSSPQKVRAARIRCDELLAKLEGE